MVVTPADVERAAADLRAHLSPTPLQLSRAFTDKARQLMKDAGWTPGPDGILEGDIARHPRDRKRMAVVVAGRSARTRYHVLEALRGHTLLRCDLDTGRTHQIRVHLAAFGHPVAGDRTYGGGSAAPRPMLHAWRLRFRHPRTGEEMAFESPPPADFRNFLEGLR